MITQAPLMLQPPVAQEIGCDEVGRGCLCGDVYAAAVLFPNPLPISDTNRQDWEMIKDSKKLTRLRIRRLAEFIKQHAVAYGLGTASVEEIDRMNILHASITAMHRALDAAWARSPHSFTSIMVDGNKFKTYVPPAAAAASVGSIGHTCIPSGDAIHLHIAAASILAKDARDTYMEALEEAHPELAPYGIKRNMGYGTKQHMDALKTLGATRFHRRSFAPVAAAPPPPIHHPSP